MRAVPIAYIGPNLTVVNDNYLLRIRNDELTLAGFHAVRKQLCDPIFWNNEVLWQQVAGSLPNYRLSKFQPLMPPWIEQEVVANYLLDVVGSKNLLAH
jgi:ATP-dependent Lhr-like helicase